MSLLPAREHAKTSVDFAASFVLLFKNGGLMADDGSHTTTHGIKHDVVTMTQKIQTKHTRYGTSNTTCIERDREPTYNTAKTNTFQKKLEIRKHELP